MRAWGPDGSVSWLPLFALVSVVVSTLVHEGAHALAAHNLGYRVEWVVLGGLAGVTAYFGRDDRPLERAAVALAGPGRQRRPGARPARGARARWAPAPRPRRSSSWRIAANVVALVANLLPFGHTDGAHLLDGLSDTRPRPRPPRLTTPRLGRAAPADPTLVADAPR